MRHQLRLVDELSRLNDIFDGGDLALRQFLGLTLQPLAFGLQTLHLQPVGLDAVGFPLLGETTLLLELRPLGGETLPLLLDPPGVLGADLLDRRRFEDLFFDHGGVGHGHLAGELSRLQSTFEVGEHGLFHLLDA